MKRCAICDREAADPEVSARFGIDLCQACRIFRYREAREVRDAIRAAERERRKEDLVAAALRRVGRGPTEEVQRQAELFRSIKESNPDFTYLAVAMAATSQEKREDPYTEDDVRNTYRAMRAWCTQRRMSEEEARWEWTRGPRTR
ncbi:MAG: hypothetical protein ACYC4R_09960 [Anaerolineae bacterium]